MKYLSQKFEAVMFALIGLLLFVGLMVGDAMVKAAPRVDAAVDKTFTAGLVAAALAAAAYFVWASYQLVVLALT